MKAFIACIVLGCVLSFSGCNKAEVATETASGVTAVVESGVTDSGVTK